MADSEKIENVLNLALNTPRQERERSLILETGYNAGTKTWELIVRYTGTITYLEAYGITVVILLNGYAILTAPESLIDWIAARDEIIYIEKPKRLFFSVLSARSVSCISALQNPGFMNGHSLHGTGIFVAVIDSGIDYFHPAFLDKAGKTRIVKLWDQTIPGTPPKGYRIGSVYTKEEIDQAIAAGRTAGRMLVPSQDVSGHGTHVAGIAAGNFGSADNPVGVATDSELLIVKLGTPKEDGFPRTSELMQALDFVVKEAAALNRPVSINLSFGNAYGSHDGTSLLATYIDSLSNVGRTMIAVGTGNEGITNGHAQVRLPVGNVFGSTVYEAELGVQAYTPSMNVQLWKEYVDRFALSIITPSGEKIGPFQRENQSSRYLAENGSVDLLVYYGTPKPYSVYQEVFFDFIPKEDYIPAGIWRIAIQPEFIINGQVDLWLPVEVARNNDTGFLNPTPDITLTIPSATRSVIAVGAYNSETNTYANFSGRGFTRLTNQIKPDLVAPGVNIVSAAVGGGLVASTGTSMATPFVTGSGALLMEWGIIQGNDPYLYGEKVKAYLRRGARQLPGFTVYPNPQVGYGALCLRNSIPDEKL